MGRHSSATPPDAYPTRPDSQQDGDGTDVPAYTPAEHDAPPGHGSVAESDPPTGMTVLSPTLLDTVPATDPAPVDQTPEAGPVGWPGTLPDHPFSWEATDSTAGPAWPGRDSPTEPTAVVDESATGTTDIEQAEEEHLDWLRHLPERRDEAPTAHPPTHGREEPTPQRETPRREWTERLVVGLIAGLVTFAATRWAGAGWSTAAWIGATVLVVVPVAAWVSTLTSRTSPPDRADRQPEPRPDQQPEH